VLEKVVPNNPPVAVCQDVSVNADEDCLGYASAVDFDGGSYDPDDDPITLTIDPEGPYPLGITVVTLTVTDESGDVDVCEATVTVVDASEPELIVIEDPIEMWPPNHKYHTFSVSDFALSVFDNCADLDLDDVYFKKASSDEPEDANGNGDGKTFNDMVLADDCQSISLRSEREGTGNGRYYTIYLEVTDGNGNYSEAVAYVTVPHNQGSEAIDDGAYYWEYSPCDDLERSFADNSDNFKNDEYVLTNYPNPFNGKTTIAFIVYESNKTILSVYNMLGEEVATIFEGNAQAGNDYKVEFDAGTLPKGVYFYHLQSGKVNAVKKMVYTY
jgi:hypothetical protein